METTNIKSAIRYREMVSKMDIDEKLELMSILIDSLKQLPKWNFAQEALLPSFSMNEIYARIDKSKCDAANGCGQDSEEMFRELEAEINYDDSEIDFIVAK